MILPLGLLVVVVVVVVVVLVQDCSNSYIACRTSAEAKLIANTNTEMLIISDNYKVKATAAIFLLKNQENYKMNSTNDLILDLTFSSC